MLKEFQEVYELTKRLHETRMENWLNDTLFTVNWWILFFVVIGLFIVWIIILDKKRIMEITTYGLMVAILGSVADVVGVSLLLWQYPHPLIPFPILDGVQIIQMPVIYMIIYQYFRKWKGFIIASIVNAFVFAFILEPLLVLLQSYETYHWKHIYSFVPYIFIAIGFKWLIHTFKQLDQNYDTD